MNDNAINDKEINENRMNNNIINENICEDFYEECSICPRCCKVNRRKNKWGVCNVSDVLVVARAALHYWEEPCISGENGSGAVFFSGCSLNCVFCQNREISRGQIGKQISVERLVEIFFELKEKGANNINLVTPTHYIPSIRKALILAKKKDLGLPVVYNTSGYENVESLRMLEGLIDIYLPDMKYFSSEISKKYSHACDYFEVADKAIEEMFRQVGEPKFSESGIIEKGVIVRHLCLPGHTKDSKEVISHLYKKYKNQIFISIMSQYTPNENIDSQKYPLLSRKLTKKEYEKVVDFAIDLGVENGFIQEGDTAKESFIPKFDLEGVLKCRKN